ncbi:2-dehydropantoate 2-reductase [Cytobacillus depressus]|uniref:2-dehydropantoate 2-reductase n=1 Tax=Cytobacillus depressus TaxID=1602942 RepID=A0A6L3VGD6_9BACI|nr:2-dehydropantoate 2-reductase [Cytobacillus depressus]KAB2338594.1 2-dehydropantoate 2-reductase [Cytobacillus depressus]
MKIGIAGAGALGCFFGALLQEAGHQVTFLARGNHLDAMKKQGLFVKKEDEVLHIRGTFTENLNDLLESELILFCVKSHDTKEMARELLPLVKKDTLILTLQNGIDNEELLCEVFGSKRILSCATYVQASIEEPGKVCQHGRVKMVIGELDHLTNEACSIIVKTFQQAGINTMHTSNILGKKWNKLLWNVTFNPLSAITTAKVGEILDDKNLRGTAESICKEAIEVASKVGMFLDKDKTFSTIFANAEFARDHQTSMLQDRLKGKSMEVESMCGVIVRKAIELKVEVPTLQTAYSILHFMNEKPQTDRLIRL